MHRLGLWAAALTLFGSTAWASPTEPRPDVVRRPATVLLITSQELAPAWKTFAEWKTKLGKSTRIVTVEEIGKRYSGKDIQEKIRACVHRHVKQQKTRWVVLGGDSLPGGKGHVPDRDTKHSLYRGRISYSDIPTDLYYVTAGDWDSNQDGVFGEWRNDKDKISYESLAAIGRIPVRTAAQVAAYTRKVIGFEARYPSAKFAKKMLYTCAVPQANYKADMLWDRYLAPTWTQGTIDKFFTNKTPWDKEYAGDYGLSPQNWVRRINSKTAGKMHMHGHGFLPGWVLERRQLASRSTVVTLKNKDAYLLMTTVSCFTGQFDSGKDPAITESMLRHEGGGAVAIVAPAREGVPVFVGRGWDPRDGQTQDGTTRLLTRYWVNGLSKGLTTGEALAQAKRDLAKYAKQTFGYHWVLCELNLLGDPTLDMRANDPVVPTVQAPKALETGAQTVTIKTLPNLTVCLWKTKEVYAVQTADAQGVATFEVSPRTPGVLTIGVTGQSINAVTRTVQVGGKTKTKAKAKTRTRWFK